MAGYKTKIERTLKREELADYLRELAANLDGNDSPGSDFKLASFDKVGLSLKMSGEQAYVRIKMRNYADPVSKNEPKVAPKSKTPRDGQAPYKPLKKGLKESFKAIFKAIHQDALPPADAVDSFLEGGRAIAAYPGKGDDHYPRFVEACDDFAEAYAEKNMARLRLLIDDLNHMKTECHARYK